MIRLGKFNLVLLGALVLAAGSANADWLYHTQEDKMTSKPTKVAMLESTNSLSLGFPYSGKNMGTLYVRQHPKSGLNVIFTVDKGQILCRSYESCSISVRFDANQPVRMSAVGSSDNDSKVIFIENESKFIAAAKKAKKILIQVTMYQAGNQVLEFESTKPLEWPQK